MIIKYRKGISIILVMLLVSGGLNGLVVGGNKAYAAEPVVFAGGSGTVEDPFQIANAAQLDRIRDHVEANRFFVLIADIDLSAYSEGVGWEPIGVYTTTGVFRGNLDGNGFKIINLKINRPGSEYNGLFTAVVSGSLTKVNLENIEVNGGYATGGLVGRNQGTISNSIVTGSVYGLGNSASGGLAGENLTTGIITNSHSSASVSGTANVGGLVGDNEGTISNSSASGSVDGVEFTGGLVGISTGFISDNSAIGSVSGGNETGGLVGSNRGPISNSFATGIVKGTTVVGGLTGSNDTTSSISDSSATGSVSGGDETGGLVGRNNGPISTSFATGIVHGAADTGGLAGLNVGVINSSNATGNVSGTEDVGGLVGESFNTINTSFASGNVSGTEDVGGLVGASNHTIANSVASGQVNGVANNAGREAKNAGGLAGANYGEATISNSSATGTVTGAVLYSGGLVGVNLGTIRTSFAEGNVSGTEDVGGLVGRSQGKISNSYAIGSADGETDVGGLVGRNLGSPISNSYAIGSVSGTKDVGSLVGYNGNDGSIITNSFYNSEIAGSLDNVDRGVGTTTTEMHLLTTYTDWNFSKIWGINSLRNDGYPYLKELPLAAIGGVTEPTIGATPAMTIASTTQYIASITWSGAPATFAASTIYTATITLTPKEGYTLEGMMENYFTVIGATTTNSANSGVITAIFPATATAASASAGITSGNAGDLVNVPLTLTNDGNIIVAMEFDLSFDMESLSLIEDSEAIAGLTLNYVADEDYYRVVIGNANNDLLTEAIGNLQFTITAGLSYLKELNVSLTNIIVSDRVGNTQDLPNATGTITVTDTVTPTVSLTASTTNFAESVDVAITSNGTGSMIAVKKWAKGNVDLDTVKADGILITGASLSLTENGTFSIYVEDEAGNGAIDTITINNVVIKGDINGDGDVDLFDWQSVANFLLAKEIPTTRQQYAADMNNNNVINVGDWVIIANRLVD